MRKPGEMAVGLFFLAVGIAFAAGAVKLGIGIPTKPNPGFFPFVDGIILIVLSSLFLLRAWGGRGGDGRPFGRMKGPAAVVLALVFYVAALERLGYVITTGLLSAVVLKVMETRLRVIVLVSLGLAVGSYLLFDRVLGVTLPPGILTAFL